MENHDCWLCQGGDGPKCPACEAEGAYYASAQLDIDEQVHEDELTAYYEAGNPSLTEAINE